MTDAGLMQSVQWDGRDVIMASLLSPLYLTLYNAVWVHQFKIEFHALIDNCTEEDDTCSQFLSDIVYVFTRFQTRTFLQANIFLSRP